MRKLLLICLVVASSGCAGETDATSAVADAAGAEDVSTGDIGTKDADGDAGSDGDDGGELADVGGSQALGDLAAAGRIAICTELSRSFDELLPSDERIEFNCTVTGIYTAAFDDSVDTDEELQAACAPIRDMCLGQDPQDDAFICPLTPEVVCDRTVDELKTCFDAETRATREFFASITCEDATISQTGGMGPGEVPIPDECVDLYDACPNLR